MVSEEDYFTVNVQMMYVRYLLEVIDSMIAMHSIDWASMCVKSGKGNCVIMRATMAYLRYVTT